MLPITLIVMAGRWCVVTLARAASYSSRRSAARNQVVSEGRGVGRGMRVGWWIDCKLYVNRGSDERKIVM